MNSGAEISPCGKYRYNLWRSWDRVKPVMVFCMMNPSTADALVDDATIRRCIGFAKREECGSIWVVNVMAYRATNPAELSRVVEPSNPTNLQHLEKAAWLKGSVLVLAWGAPKGGWKLRAYYHMARMVFKKYKPMCFGATASGDPKHPLYLKSDAPLVPWIPPANLQ